MTADLTPDMFYPEFLAEDAARLTRLREERDALLAACRQALPLVCACMGGKFEARNSYPNSDRVAAALLGAIEKAEGKR